jgi:hypothetical protein
MSTPFFNSNSIKPMGRLPFVITTGVMLAIVYLELRVILAFAVGYERSFPDGWQFLDPVSLIVGDGGPWIWTVLVHAQLAIGLLVIGLRRARDAGWSPWIGIMMMLPVIRLFVFVVLAIIPSAHHTNVLDLPREGLLGRIIPRSALGSAVASVLITTLLVIPLGFVNVSILEDYGLALFIGLPFLLGAVSAYLHSYHTPRTLRQSIGVAGTSLTIVLAMIFFMAMEGLVCLIMATPIAGAITLAGALIGHSLSRNEQGRTPAITMLMLLTPSLMAFEAVERGSPPLFQVVSSVRVNASPQQVWDQLVTFSHMDEPTELVFRAGISYPIEARIIGTGVGACRYCQFNTGPFVEPITVWDEPRLLAFDVLAFPPPMTELSIYEKVNAPHIHGFFQSHQGQFKLIEQADGSTLLEGTTWYTHEIWPTWYWKLWSDNILHAIHGRVLEHIKEEAEG